MGWGRRRNQSLKIDVNYKPWLTLPLSMASNVVKSRPPRLTGTAAAAWTVSRAWPSPLQIRPRAALGKKVYSKQKTTVNLLVVRVHSVRRLRPVSERHSDPPRFLCRPFNSVQVSTPPGSLCWPSPLPVHSPSQSIWGPFLFGTQIKWVTSIMNLQLYYDLLSCVIFPNRMWALRPGSI